MPLVYDDAPLGLACVLYAVTGHGEGRQNEEGMHMRTSVKFGLNTFGLGLAGAALLVGLGGVAQAQTKEPMKVGGLFSTTGGGASVGISAAVAAKMAIEDINKAGGILGRQVVMLQGDDATDTTQAVNETKRLVLGEKVEIMFGPLFSPPTLAAANAVMKDHTAITYWSFATSGAITVDIGPTLFPAGPSGDVFAETMVDYAVNVRKAKRIALLLDDAGQSVLVINKIKELMKARGVTAVAEQQMPMGTTDPTPNLLALRRANADFIIYSNQAPPDAGRVFKTMDELGWDVPVAGNNGFVVNYGAIARVAGPGIRNLAAGVGVKAFTYCTGDAPGTSAYAKFLVRLKQYVPNLDANASIVQMAEMYDIIMIAKAAAEAVGSTDGKKMTEWLETKGGTLETISGKLFLSKTNHFLQVGESLTMAENLDKMRSDGLYKRAGC